MSLLDLLSDWFSSNSYQYRLVRLSQTTWYIYLTLNKPKNIINNLPVLISEVDVSVPEWVGTNEVILESMKPSDPKFFEIIAHKIKSWECYD